MWPIRGAVTAGKIISELITFGQETVKAIVGMYDRVLILKRHFLSLDILDHARFSCSASYVKAALNQSAALSMCFHRMILSKLYIS